MLGRALIGLCWALACVNAPQPQTAPRPTLMFKSQVDPRYAFLEKVQQDRHECKPGRLSKEQWLRLWKQGLDQDCGTPGYEWNCRNEYVGLETVRGRPLNTRCEDPTVQVGWGFFADNLAEFFANRDPAVKVPPWVSLRTGQMNAMAVRIRDGDYAILMNSDIQRLHMDVVRFLINMMELNVEESVGRRTLNMVFSPARVRKLLAEQPEYARYFAELIGNAVQGIRLPNPLEAPGVDHEGRLLRHSFEASGLHQRVVAALAISGVEFVVAHEYAHAFLGHEHGRWQTEPETPGRHARLEVADNSDQVRELDADRLGLRLLLENQSAGADPAMRMFIAQAPEVMMVSLHLLELERRRLGLATLDTHPSASLRRDALAGERRRLAVAESSASSTTLAAQLDQIAAFCWSQANGLCSGADTRFREHCKLGSR